MSMQNIKKYFITEKKAVAVTTSVKKTLVGAQITTVTHARDEINALTPCTHAMDVTNWMEATPPLASKPYFDVDCPSFATQLLIQMGWVTPLSKTSLVLSKICRCKCKAEREADGYKQTILCHKKQTQMMMTMLSFVLFWCTT